MSFDLDKELRAALRKVDPAEGFAQRVATRLARERAAPGSWLSYGQRRTVSALAACVLLAAIALYGWQMRREQQGLEARRQLIEALRLTGEKLDQAYRGVNDVSRPAPADDTGA
jgi:hypothetical protein